MNRFVFPLVLILLVVISFGICLPVTTGASPEAAPQTDNSSKTAANAIDIPADTAILAKLVSQLNFNQCKPGDLVEAVLTHDVKVGHQTLLKSGAKVVGQISNVQTTPDSTGLYKVGIVFDHVQVKNSDPVVLHLEVQAIAPPPTQAPDNARDPRGMAQTNIQANVGGNLSGAEGPQGELTVRSKGPIRLPDLELGTIIADGTHTTVLATKKNNLRLAKDFQIVFRVFNP